MGAEGLQHESFVAYFKVSSLEFTKTRHTPQGLAALHCASPKPSLLPLDSRSQTKNHGLLGGNPYVMCVRIGSTET
jgi:hypothetical protein